MADVVANGVRLHYQRLGTGTDGWYDPRKVVFIHGLVMDNLSSFYFTLANPVAQTADVFLYDLRGHGLSDRPLMGYRVADFVADLAALIKALDIREPIHLVGNSFGGTLALAYAAAHPERIEGIVVIDAHDGTAGFSAQMAATLGLQGEARDAKIAETFQSWLGRHSERKRTRLARAAEALIEGTTLVHDLASSPPLTRAQLARINAPVLALYGETSDVLDRGRALAAALPDCDLQILPGCTHSVLWEATGEVRTRVTTWLARRDKP